MVRLHLVGACQLRFELPLRTCFHRTSHTGWVCVKGAVSTRIKFNTLTELFETLSQASLILAEQRGLIYKVKTVSNRRVLILQLFSVSHRGRTVLLSFQIKPL